MDSRGATGGANSINFMEFKVFLTNAKFYENTLNSMEFMEFGVFLAPQGVPLGCKRDPGSAHPGIALEFNEIGVFLAP